MSFQATVHRVMIASPGDVRGERSIIREVLSEWNAINAEERRTVLIPLGWEIDVAPEMGGEPQRIINSQILRDADLLVGMFWTRIGTPTTGYASGTVEEIEQHLAAGRPAMLYFSSAPINPESIDFEQYQHLKAFRTSCQSRGVYDTYADLTDFRQKFARALAITMNGDRFDTPAVDAHDSAASGVAGASAARAAPQKRSPTELGQTLSTEAQRLLRTAATDGDGIVALFRFGGGAAVQSGSETFNEEQSARSLAIWEGAIEELETVGLLKAGSDAREIFHLTRLGYETADTLRST